MLRTAWSEVLVSNLERAMAAGPILALLCACASWQRVALPKQAAYTRATLSRRKLGDKRWLLTHMRRLWSCA